MNRRELLKMIGCIGASIALRNLIGPKAQSLNDVSWEPAQRDNELVTWTPIGHYHKIGEHCSNPRGREPWFTMNIERILADDDTLTLYINGKEVDKITADSLVSAWIELDDETGELRLTGRIDLMNDIIVSSV